MATKLTNWLNYAETGPELEINDQPSQTQPDEVLSIREMLQRHVSGLPVHGNEGSYLPEEMGYVPDLRALDLTEIEEYRDYYADQFKRLKEEADERSALEKQAELEEAQLQEEIKQSHINSKKSPKKTPDVESPS